MSGDYTSHVVIDIETTGLDPGVDRIIEIAALEATTQGKIIDEWVTPVDPCRPVHATNVHGLRARDLVGAPTFVDIMNEVSERLTGKTVVAHNVDFDLAFLNAEYGRAGGRLPSLRPLCTLELARSRFPRLRRRRLANCCRAAGVEYQDRHTALGDARATAALLATLLGEGATPDSPTRARAGA